MSKSKTVADRSSEVSDNVKSYRWTMLVGNTVAKAIVFYLFTLAGWMAVHLKIVPTHTARTITGVLVLGVVFAVMMTVLWWLFHKMTRLTLRLLWILTPIVGLFAGYIVLRVIAAAAPQFLVLKEGFWITLLMGLIAALVHWPGAERRNA